MTAVYNQTFPSTLLTREVAKRKKARRTRGSPSSSVICFKANCRHTLELICKRSASVTNQRNLPGTAAIFKDVISPEWLHEWVKPVPKDIYIEKTNFLKLIVQSHSLNRNKAVKLCRSEYQMMCVDKPDLSLDAARKWRRSAQMRYACIQY